MLPGLRTCDFGGPQDTRWAELMGNVDFEGICGVPLTCACSENTCFLFLSFIVSLPATSQIAALLSSLGSGFKPSPAPCRYSGRNSEATRSKKVQLGAESGGEVVFPSPPHG